MSINFEIWEDKVLLVEDFNNDLNLFLIDFNQLTFRNVISFFSIAIDGYLLILTQRKVFLLDRNIQRVQKLDVYINHTIKYERGIAIIEHIAGSSLFHYFSFDPAKENFLIREPFFTGSLDAKTYNIVARGDELIHSYKHGINSIAPNGKDYKFKTLFPFFEILNQLFEYNGNIYSSSFKRDLFKIDDIDSNKTQVTLFHSILKPETIFQDRNWFILITYEGIQIFDMETETIFWQSSYSHLDQNMLRNSVYKKGFVYHYDTHGTSVQVWKLTNAIVPIGFLTLIATGLSLVETSVWSSFLSEDLYDPRLLVLIWRMAFSD